MLKTKQNQFSILHKRHYEQFADGTVKDIEDEIPFEVPDGWAWCRLGEISIVKSSKRVFENDYAPAGIPFYRSLEIGQLYRNEKLSQTLYITKEHYEELKRNYGVPSSGDILITSVGSIGNTWICDDREFYYKDGNVTQISKSALFDSSYMNYFLHSDLMNKQITDTVGGSAYNALTIEKLKNLIIPLPPPNEQQQIVKTIAKIFSQIESIDNNKSELDITIKQAKSKILNLAIHGKLVPQDPNDEPAEELLKRIATSDNRPYKKFEEEEPFEIPSNWSWCFLGDICSKIKRGKSPKYVDKSTIMAFAQKCNQKDGPTSLDKALYIDETTLKKYPEEEKMQFNDIVINSTGTGTLGRVGIFNCFIPNDVNAVYPDSHVTTVRILPEIDKLYCYYFIKNKQSYLETMGEGSTNQKELKPDTISSLCFPLPPYPEQKRIVFKIEELFSSLETIVSNLD